MDIGKEQNKYYNKSITNINLILPEEKEIVISSKKREHIPGFIMIGNGIGKRMRDGALMEPIDALDLFQTFSPQEWFVFNTLRKYCIKKDEITNKYYTTCKVKIEPIRESNDKKRFKEGYKRLKEKNVVLRLKRGGWYFINPNIIIPTCYENELIEYITLMKKYKINPTKSNLFSTSSFEVTKPF